MEEMDNFDRLIKEKLDGKESFISDRVWDNIQASLPKEKNRNPRRLLFALSAFCLLAAASLYFYLNTKDSDGKERSRVANAGEHNTILNDSTPDNYTAQNESSINSGLNSTNQNNSNKKSEQALNTSIASNSSTNTKNDANSKNESLRNQFTSLKSESNTILSDEIKNSERGLSRNDGNGVDNKKLRKDLISENETTNTKSSKTASEKLEQSNSTKDNWQIASNKNNDAALQSSKNSYNKDRDVNNNQTRNSKGQEIAIENSSENTSGSGSIKDDNSAISVNKTRAENRFNTTSENNQEKFNNSANEIKIASSNEAGKNNQNSAEGINRSSQGSGNENSMKADGLSNDINSNQTDSATDKAKQSTTILAKTSEEKIKDSLEKKANQEKQPIEENAGKNKKSTKEFSFPTINVDVFLTPTYTQSKLSSDVSNIESIKKNENPKFSMGAGARISVNITDRIRAGLGLQYSSYGDRNKINSTKEKELLYVNYNIHQGPNGAWVYEPIDTIKYKKSFSTKKATVNSYKYVSIPVFIGYQVLDKKIGLTITGGITANILAHGQTNSLVMTSDTTLIVNTESSSGSNSPFRKLVYSAFVSPGLTYKVNEKLKILLDPGMTWFLSSIYKPDYAINRRIFAVECRAGVQFTIGNK